MTFTSKMTLLHQLVDDLRSDWRKSKNADTIRETLVCAEEFEKYVMLDILLWGAISESDWLLADVCVSEGHPLNPSDDSNWGALHTLITDYGDRSDAAEWMLSRGADVNRRGRCNCTPLHEASTMCCVGIAKMLLAFGADINASTGFEDKTTALMHAVYSDCSPVVKVLLDAGANVTLRDSKGRTAKDIAIELSRTTLLRQF